MGLVDDTCVIRNAATPTVTYINSSTAYSNKNQNYIHRRHIIGTLENCSSGLDFADCKCYWDTNIHYIGINRNQSTTTKINTSIGFTDVLPLNCSCKYKGTKHSGTGTGQSFVKCYCRSFRTDLKNSDGSEAY